MLYNIKHSSNNEMKRVLQGHIPIDLATQKVEAGGSLELRGSMITWATRPTDFVSKASDHN